MLRLLDILFLVFHTSLIVFNMFGWIWKTTRKANLIAIVLTAASWSLLGLIVGTPGYCPFTDWHFEILNRLGVNDLPASYIKYLADRITGMDFKQSLVDAVTLWGLLAAMLFSLLTNIRDYIRIRRSRAGAME